jgi:hypothetical protein
MSDEFLGWVEQPMDTVDGERDTHRVKVGKEAGNEAYMHARDRVGTGGGSGVGSAGSGGGETP